MNVANPKRVFVVPSVVSRVIDRGSRAGDPCTELKLSSQESEWTAVSWMPFARLAASDGSVMVGQATVLDTRDDLGRDPLVLVDWQPLDAITLFDRIPSDRCPEPGTVLQVCDMVKAIESEALRRFMACVFSIDDVFHYYWTCPASLAHHHRGAGGLAIHSLEVAVAASSVHGLTPWQRDLVMVYALLHDVGKLRSYEDGDLTEEASRIGHEQIGYRMLRPAIDQLNATDPELGTMLDDLLAGAWKQDYRHPAAALGGIVRALDRFSTDTDLRRRKSLARATQHHYDDVM